MTETKKRIVITAIIGTFVFLLLLLGVLYLITKSFVFIVGLKFYLSLLKLPLCVYIVRRCFKNQIKESMNRTLLLCGLAFAVDVILDTVRYVLSSGVSSVLFLPLWLPLCFMVILYYLFKDAGSDKREKKLIFIIGIPLLLLALYFEVLSFVEL